MKFSTYDLEGEGKVFGNRFVNASIYDGINGSIYHSIDNLLDEFELQGGIFYAHYGADYDIKLLLDRILNRFIIKVTPINNKLAAVKCYRKTNKSKKLFELRDTQFLMPQSLKQLASSYDIGEQKQDIDRSKIHRLTKKEQDDYVISDARILHKVLSKFMLETGTTDLKTMKYTIPSIAFAEWKSGFPELKTRSPLRYEAIIRASYYGGRVDVFRRKGENLYYYDVNSMYPYVMGFQYPGGVSFRTSTYLPGRFGIYLCDVDATHLRYPKYPFLPYRKNNKLLFPLGYFRGTYTSVEINKARELGYIINIIDGIAWSEKIDFFSDYVRKWHSIKQKSSGAKKQIAKLFLNSLYGKFGQKRIFKKMHHGALTKKLIQEHDVYTIDKEHKLYSYDYKDKTPFTRCQIAAFVTSYARVHLYSVFEQAIKKGGNIYYCDTDSVVTDVTIPASHELGGLELEQTITKGIFLLPKVYAFINEQQEIIIRAKGFNTRQLSYENFEAAFNGDFSGFKTHKAGLVGFLEGVRRKMNYSSAINRSRHMINGLEKRVVSEDGITTSPIFILKT